MKADDTLRDLARIHVRAVHEYAGYRILVVDDSIVNCQVAVHLLKNLGCHADAATSSEAAIHMHVRQRYDLILMDCQMPGLDGYQTTERIRSAETGNRRTAIIGWTTTLQAENRERCIAAGMDDLIEKPIRKEMVQKMIARWLHPAISLDAPIVDATENNLESMHRGFGVQFAELAATYQADTSKRLIAMREAAGERDHIKIAAIAHVLGGSCASIGAIRLSGMCRELENCCKAAFPKNLDILLDEIHDEYVGIDSKIRTLLQTPTL